MDSFWSTKRVLLTGSTGFIGSHIKEKLIALGVQDLYLSKRPDNDLTKETEVQKLYDMAKPDIVFHLAGLVGGILANKQRPADFFYQNLLMGTFMLHYASENKIDAFVAAGAGCGYPLNAPMPLKEDDFWIGYPQEESAPYSLAKRLLTIQADAYDKQHQLKTVICIPGNVYGTHDNFNLNDSHVIPALVRKFVEASQEKKDTIEVWGTGKASRDFVYVEDVVDGMIQAAQHSQKSNLFNISSGYDTSIGDVCALLQSITGFQGDLRYNTDKPDGQQKRLFDISKAEKELNFKPKISLKEGLQQTVSWYQEHYHDSTLRR
ncbi:MAG: GDP-fucose synthetase [Rickettsiales bacterium]|nr:GDP-fucose synthetase [Rickettsiales bacterium]|tara:strand:- start:1349 stop:2308 length:960 start_codon:yes stop_codon:yes gene_type:complete